jgi:hypothetical protein
MAGFASFVVDQIFQFLPLPRLSPTDSKDTQVFDASSKPLYNGMSIVELILQSSVRSINIEIARSVGAAAESLTQQPEPRGWATEQKNGNCFLEGVYVPK